MTLHRQRAKQCERYKSCQDRHRSSEIDFGCGQPAVCIFGSQAEIVDAHAAHEDESGPCCALCERAGVRLRFAIELPHQPASAKQRITGYRTNPGKQRVWGEPVEPAARVGPVDDINALQQRAKGHPLCHRSHQAAAGEGEVPEASMGRVAPPELESHPSKDQPQ